MVLRASAAVVVGLAVGAVLGWPRLQVATTPIGDPASCQAQLNREMSTYIQAREQASKAERDLADARRRYAAAAATPRTWPDLPPSGLDPAMLRDHLEGALADLPAALLELDCEQYPCIASVAWEHQPEDAGLLDAGEGKANLPGRLLAELQPGPPYDALSIYFTGRHDPREDGRSVFSFSFFDTNDLRSAKADGSAGQPELEGSILDQTQGRAESAADRWAREDF